MYGLCSDNGKLEIKYAALAPLTLCRAVEQLDRAIHEYPQQKSGSFARKLEAKGVVDFRRRRIDKNEGYATSRHTTVSFLDDHGNPLLNDGDRYSLKNMGYKMLRPLANFIPLFTNDREDFRRYRVGSTTPHFPIFNILSHEQLTSEAKMSGACLILHQVIDEDMQENKWLENRLPADVDPYDAVLATLVAVYIATGQLDNTHAEKYNIPLEDLNIATTPERARDLYVAFQSELEETLCRAALDSDKSKALSCYYANKAAQMANTHTRSADNSEISIG